jgi:FtsP/CotA-like multicopper oxidase with cupredoxin domain
VLGITAAIIAGGTLSLYFLLPFFPAHGNVCDSLPHSPPQGFAEASNNSSTATFTIIESDPNSTLAIQGYPNGPFEGMNGSAYHYSVPWPVMVVHRGQAVSIHVYNCASSESHGFAISHYFNAGVTVHAGSSYTVSFTASQEGNFTVYCNVFCAIHPLMQNGRLVVTS